MKENVKKETQPRPKLLSQVETQTQTESAKHAILGRLRAASGPPPGRLWAASGLTKKDREIVRNQFIRVTLLKRGPPPGPSKKVCKIVKTCVNMLETCAKSGGGPWDSAHSVQMAHKSCFMHMASTQAGFYMYMYTNDDIAVVQYTVQCCSLAWLLGLA